MPQNYKNHSQLVPIYHFAILPILILCIVGSVWNLVLTFNAGHGKLAAAIIFVLSDMALAMAFFARGFALKAQDRAIRAEENLRYFAITGKLHDKRLRTGQIIALRFASDEELVSLSEKVANENLKGKEIKQLIKNWKADHYRV